MLRYSKLIQTVYKLLHGQERSNDFGSRNKIEFLQAKDGFILLLKNYV
jgi:hypothetical protein